MRSLRDEFTGMRWWMILLYGLMVVLTPIVGIAILVFTFISPWYPAAVFGLLIVAGIYHAIRHPGEPL